MNEAFGQFVCCQIGMKSVMLNFSGIFKVEWMLYFLFNVIDLLNNYVAGLRV